MEDLYEQLSQNIIQINNNNTKQQITTCIQNIKNKMQNLTKVKRIPYLLFLAEINAIKLQKFDEAFTILKNMVAQFQQQSKNNEIVLVYTSEVAYLKFMEQKYEEANEFLRRSIFTMGQDPKLKMICKSFFSRVGNAKNGTIDYHLLHGFRQLNAKDNNIAFSMFLNVYYKLAKIKASKQLQINYFVSSMLLSLQNGIEEQQYLQVIQKIKEKFEFDSQLNKQYLGWKQFLSTLAWIIFQPQQQGVLEECCQLQLLAIYKLKKAIYQSQQDEGILSDTLKQMSKKMSNMQLLQKRTLFKRFVQKEYDRLKFMKKVKKLIIYNEVFYKLRRLNQSYVKQPRHSLNSANIFDMESQTKPQIRYIQSQLNSQDKSKKFVGSLMTKIHANSDGYEERFFYIKPNQLKKNKYRLYYAKRQDKTTDNDQYYSLKGLKRLEMGKTSKQLQRKSCDIFDENHCFSLINDKQTRSFYVKDKNDFDNWIGLIKETAKMGLSRMKKSTDNLMNDSVVKPLMTSAIKKTVIL